MLLVETVYIITILFEYLNAHSLMRKAAKQGMLDVNNPLQKMAYQHQVEATSVSYLMTAIFGVLAIWVSYLVANLVSNKILGFIILIVILAITFVIRNVLSALIVTLLNNHFKEHLSVKRENVMTDAKGYAQDKLKSGTLSADQLNDLINHMKGDNNHD